MRHHRRGVGSRRAMISMALPALAVLLGACGSSGGSASPAPPGGSNADVSASGPTGSPSGSASGGTATLTIGDDRWEFTTVQCAFGTDETRNDDWDFSLSAIQDGLQLSATGGAPGGRYGDSVELNDIKDFENPSVGWSAPFVPVGSGQAKPTDVLEIDGKTVTASVDFVDTRDDSSFAQNAGVAGTLEASCP